MKHCLIAWTAEFADGQSYSGNATMTSDKGLPQDETIIEIIKSNNPKLKDSTITLQDKLEFDSQQELDSYGRV